MSRNKKITVPKIVSRKTKGRKIVMITAYDATFARLAEQGGADMVLVGDSLGMVIQGHENTLPVTLEDVVYHTRAVSRGLSRAHLCSDMPFMTYKISPEQALHAAGRLVQEGRAESVKLEGGIEVACGKGSLIIGELQLEGSRKMGWEEFTRGHQLTLGTRFG